MEGGSEGEREGGKAGIGMHTRILNSQDVEACGRVSEGWGR